MKLLHYIRAHPFSTMALCNIVGDGCYLGFAFAAAGFVSGPKLAGALCTMGAHLMLLAYGDDQARKVAHEPGFAARILLRLRGWSKMVMGLFPEFLQKRIRAKPVGIPFMILSLNGLGLTVDALMQPLDFAGGSQLGLGLLILCGCLAFSAADFIGSQKYADILTKTAATLLTCAIFPNTLLALQTLNFFLFVSIIVFGISNLSGLLARIDKNG
jgi:hypothetical protein